jgi:hypothetical protein
MKLFNRSSSTNILGATGLSRAALRSVFAETGLFGRDSSLPVNEQAAVYAELQLPAGAVPPIASSHELNGTRSIEALRGFTRWIQQHDGNCTDAIWSLAASGGVAEGTLLETLHVVRSATLLYGAGRPSRRDVQLARLPLAPAGDERVSLLQAG